MNEKMIDSLQAKCNQMASDDRPRDLMFREMDKMFRNEWDLPEEMKAYQWVYKTVDTSPHDALDTAIKGLTVEYPQPTMLPLGPDPHDKVNANKIERGLGWEWMKADKRSKSRLTPNIIRSALRYDEVCVQVVHLPSHYDSLETVAKLDKDEDKLNALLTKRKAALRMGDFAINVRNPQNVHSRHDDMGLESVFMVQTMLAQEVYNTWGNMAAFVKESGEDWGEEILNLCEYVDNKFRLV